MMNRQTTTEQMLADDLSKRHQVLYGKHMQSSPTINYDMMLAFLNTAEAVSMNCDDYCYDNWHQHFEVIRKGLLKRREGWSKICGIELKYVD